MKCEDRAASIDLYAAGALPDAEVKELREHLATGCPTCQAELIATSAVASMLPLTLAPVSPPAELKPRLMRRIDDEVAAGPISAFVSPEPETLSMRLFRLFVPAAVAAGITLVGTHYYMTTKIVDAQQKVALLQQRGAAAFQIEASLNEQLQAVQDRLEKQTRQVDYLTTQASADQTQLAALKRQFADQSAVVAMLESDHVRLVDLKPTESQPGAVAHVVWDQVHGKWAVLVANMKPAPAGETYELWFVTTSDQKIRVGIFDVDHAGSASVLIDLPPDVGPLKLVAVTNEKAGGVEVPAGHAQMVGAI